MTSEGKREKRRKALLHRRRARRIRMLCQLVICLALVSVFITLAYAVHYTFKKQESVDPKFVDTLNGLAQYYNAQTDSGERISKDTMSKGNEMEKDVGQEEEDAGSILERVQDSGMKEGKQEEKGNSMEGKDSMERENPMKGVPSMENENIGEEKSSSEIAESRRKLVNGLTLTPHLPDRQELEKLLDELMPQITADCIDVYDQVKACYDYLINNCVYSDTIKYDYEYDAYLLLTELHGSCTYYAAALHYMLRYLGIENVIVNGYRYPHPEFSDATSFHRWIEITMEDIPYILDPQWEDSLSYGGSILYERFLLTHEELGKYYVF